MRTVEAAFQVSLQLEGSGGVALLRPSSGAANQPGSMVVVSYMCMNSVTLSLYAIGRGEGALPLILWSQLRPRVKTLTSSFHRFEC